MANIKLQQLVFDFTVNGRVMAVSTQNRISAISTHVASSLESALEKYDNPDSHISIERLELNLGVIDYSHFEEELLQRIVKAIDNEAALKSCHTAISSLPHETEMKCQPLAEHEMSVIKHFLEIGLGIDQTTDLKITKTRIKKALYETPALVDWFIGAQSQNVNPLKRLLYHLNDSEVYALVLGKGFIELEMIPELIKSLFSHRKFSHEEVRSYVWRCVFIQKAAGKPKFDYFRFVKHYAAKVSATFCECVKSLSKPVIEELLRGNELEIVNGYLNDVDMTSSANNQGEDQERSGSGGEIEDEDIGLLPVEYEDETADHITEKGYGEDQERGGIGGEIEDEDVGLLPVDFEDETTDHITETGYSVTPHVEECYEEESQNEEMQRLVETEWRESRSGKIQSELFDEFLLDPNVAVDKKVQMADKFYLHNAGIVIVAPFLEHFFKSLGFVENDLFVNLQMQKRAAVLLHYLYPTHEISEDSLILNKLLCGLAIVEPVPVQMKPKSSELEEISELIRSVIHYWSALKDTSVEGFKYNFLNRTAVLTNSEYQWHLLIKRESIDVLLETLPWSIAVIKHPWMQKAIMVEW